MPKSPKLFAAILALSVAVALVLGASGGATASALTKGAVKKIAAKVVKKKAGSLSVAHAATADTATNANALGGKPPAAYSDDTIRYSLVSTTLSGSKSFALGGLTPGATYYIHYHLIVGSSPGTPTGNCIIAVPGAPTQYAWGYGTVFANAVSVDAGAVVTIPNTGSVNLDCNFGATVSTYANQPSAAEATLLDSVTSRAATATPGRSDAGPATPGVPPRP